MVGREMFDDNELGAVDREIVRFSRVKLRGRIS